MAPNKQFGLGKGLGALLGGDVNIDATQARKPVGYINKDVITVTAQPETPQADIKRIPTDLIEPNPYQPRMSFDAEALEELAESIRTLGLIQPITVRKKAGGVKYQIISGERRFRACRLAGMDMVPAYIMDANDQGMLEMAIVENIQRKDLDPIEVALSYQRLIDECNLTQEQMADRVGKKRASVTNHLRLLKLPAKVQHDIKVGLLSVGHAKVILGVQDPAIQESLCDSVVSDGLSVRQLEEKVQKLSGQKPVKPAKHVEEQDLPEIYFKAAEIVGKFFDNNITLKRTNRGKGSLTVKFTSDEQMLKFVNALEKADL